MHSPPQLSHSPVCNSAANSPLCWSSWTASTKVRCHLFASPPPLACSAADGSRAAEQQRQPLCVAAGSLRKPVAPHRHSVHRRPALLTERTENGTDVSLSAQVCFCAACSSAAASRPNRPHAPTAKSRPEPCLQSIYRAVTSQVRLNPLLHFHPRWHIKRRLIASVQQAGRINKATTARLTSHKACAVRSPFVLLCADHSALLFPEGCANSAGDFH